MFLNVYIHTHHTNITINPSFRNKISKSHFQFSQSKLKSPCNSSNYSEYMESPNFPSPRPITITANREKIETPVLQSHEHKDSANVLRSDHLISYTGALEILKETLRILRCNPIVFIAIAVLLIYPVPALNLSNLLVDQSVVNRLASRLQLIAKSNGLPLNSLVKQSCYKFSEMAISSMVYFPLHCTLLLISKAAVVYTVECSYSQKKCDSFKFFVMMKTIWRRIIKTYLSINVLIVGCIVLLMMLLICVSRLFYVIGFSPNSISYIYVLLGVFSMVFLAYIVIICDISMVISILEDVSGPRSFLRSSELIKGQTRAGLMIFLGSTIGMAIIKGLFELRVKSLSYRDERSRIWERLVLVLVYCFVVLIDFMMSTVFYFSCKSCGLEILSVDCKRVLHANLSCNKV